MIPSLLSLTPTATGSSAASSQSVSSSIIILRPSDNPGLGTSPSNPAGNGENDTLKIVLDCVFVIAACAMVMSFVIWRCICLRHSRRPLTHFFTPSSSQSQPHLSRLVPTGATMLPYSAYSDSRLTPLARAYTHQRVTGVGVDSAGRRFDSQYPASGESEIADVLPAYDDKDGPPRYQEALGEVHISGPSPPMVSDTPIAHAEPRDMISSHSNANANYQSR